MSTHKPKKIDQKEYLKKYLSGDKVKKKHKKHKSKHSVKVKIIDDDVSTLDNGGFIDEELLLTGDDAPQIVGEYIEDVSQEGVSKWRSISVKQENKNVEYIKTETDLPNDPWGSKAIKIKKEIKTEPTSPVRKKIQKSYAESQDSDQSPPRRAQNHSRRPRNNSKDSSPRRRRSNSDQSPPRKNHSSSSRQRNRSIDLSPKRKRQDSDQSPPRKNHSSSSRQRNRSIDLSPRRKRQDSDQSPPRKNHSSSSRQRNRSIDLSPRRKRSDSDQSPPRKNYNSSSRQRNSNVDLSPRKKRRNSDQSPQRNTHSSSSRQGNRSIDLSPRSKRRDRDQPNNRRKSSVELSPHRKGYDSDQSPPRKQKQNPVTRRRSSSSDLSPHRRSDRDHSPPRKHSKSFSKNHSMEKQTTKRKDKDHSIPREKSPLRGQNNYRDQSPHVNNSSYRKKSRWEKSPSPPPTHKSKATKTLEGKKAGLQNAQALKAETEERHRKEEIMYAKMSDDVSGRNAEVQVRSTGRRGQRARDAKAEDPEVQRKKEEREKKKKELYDRWGRGLKQIENHRARVAEQSYESSKPLARYANDDDLEQHLREQERLDDPMLEYMRRKKKERQKQSNIPTIPVYEGPFPENRFGIRPGYRWDGVDRSNGYEKKWFDERSKKHALQDEAYKYSVEDM